MVLTQVMPKFERLSTQVEDRSGIILTWGSMHASNLREAISPGQATIIDSRVNVPIGQIARRIVQVAHRRGHVGYRGVVDHVLPV